MALITCAECKAVVSDKAAACPRCGAPIETATGSRPRSTPTAAHDRNNMPSAQEKARPIWPWLVAAPIVAFFGYGLFASNTPEGQARSRERRAIEACWEEQKRKSLGQGEQRFIAGACETMETEFQRKHGVRP